MKITLEISDERIKEIKNMPLTELIGEAIKGDMEVRAANVSDEDFDLKVLIRNLNKSLELGYIYIEAITRDNEVGDGIEKIIN